MKSNMKTHLLKVGIIGYSSQAFNKDAARTILLERFQKLIQVHGANIEIISGLTWLGIPGLAYEVARSLGLKTVGIACSKAFDHKIFPCDRSIIIGSQWGDESGLFLDSIDLLIRIGGGKQSLRECQLAKEKGIPLEEFELTTI